ncbi:MAG TPA: YbgC/FadM family acyl-CoA thioesterase [Rubrivivax sp.]|nr:YbgC/FadM family acyl-CoA thioesterase [Rubrivivax sp.]
MRVRWAEVDMQQIVFNGHYLMYFDTAVAGYWRALAMPYHETMQQLQGDLFVRKATLEYEASARYDDQLQIGIRCGRIGTSSMVLHAAAFRGEQRLVHGDLVYVFADPATHKSKPVPPVLRSVFEDFEAGRPVLDVAVGDWDLLGEQARAIRQAVFEEEQKIPADMVVDAHDNSALHGVARNHFGLAVASGRLLTATDGTSRIGRMATRASLRGAGLGQSVLKALLDEARRRGDRHVVLDAQLPAVPFYARNGFVRSGVEFIEAGLPHIEMRLAL